VFVIKVKVNAKCPRGGDLCKAADHRRFHNWSRLEKTPNGLLYNDLALISRVNVRGPSSIRNILINRDSKIADSEARANRPLIVGFVAVLATLLDCHIIISIPLSGILS